MFLPRPKLMCVYDYDKDQLYVHSQFATKTQIPVLVLLQVLSGASLAKNAQCVMGGGSAFAKKTVIFEKKITVK